MIVRNRLAIRAFVSRHNPPSLRLNAVASALLVATFAAAVYVNHHRPLRGFW